MLPAEILIVEDEPIIAIDLAQCVADLGYTVQAVLSSGAEAVAQAHARAPDLVLMDIGLPGGMTGLEAASRIWEECKIPIVYVTAHAGQQSLAQARPLAPFLVVQKPFDPTELQHALAQALAIPG